MTSLSAAVPELPQGSSPYLDGFDTNIGHFVQEHGRSVHLPSLPDVSCWVLALHGAKATLELHVYKERLAEGISPICDQCRIIGRQRCLALSQPMHLESHLASEFLLLLRRVAASPCV